MSYKIAILGLGNVGLHLTKALTQKGIEVYTWNRSETSKKYFNFIKKSQRINCLTELPSDINLCIICTNDDNISEIASRLKNFKGIIAHTSGSLSIEILKEFSSNIAVIYPLQTFSKDKKLDYTQIPIFIETLSNEDFLQIKSSIYPCFTNIKFLNSELRQKLHLSAVFANNFVNACVLVAKEISKSNDLDFNDLKPLIKETFHKLEKLEPENSQTGPAVRKNNRIINQHIKLLDNNKLLQNIYRDLSFYITKTINK